MDMDFFGSPNQEDMDLVTMVMMMEMESNLQESTNELPPSVNCNDISATTPPFYSAPPSAAPPTTPINPSHAQLQDQFLTCGGGYPFAGPNMAAMAAMKEMMFCETAMEPINVDPEWVKPPKRRNVKISKDPQSVAARHRRERISERIRILQRMVPGGTKMDTASMLDEAVHYVKFLKTQVQSLEMAAAAAMGNPAAAGFSSPYGEYMPCMGSNMGQPCDYGQYYYHQYMN